MKRAITTLTRTKSMRARLSRLLPPHWRSKLFDFTPPFQAIVQVKEDEARLSRTDCFSGLSIRRGVALSTRDLNHASNPVYLREGHRRIFVNKSKDPAAGNTINANLRYYQCTPSKDDSITLIVSQVHICGITKFMEDTQITFEELHLITRLSQPVDKMHSIQKKANPSPTKILLDLTKDLVSLTEAHRNQTDGLPAKPKPNRPAHALLSGDAPYEFFTQRQTNEAPLLLKHCARNPPLSKLKPMNNVTAIVPSDLTGLIARVISRNTKSPPPGGINQLISADCHKARVHDRCSSKCRDVLTTTDKSNSPRINHCVTAPQLAA